MGLSVHQDINPASFNGILQDVGDKGRTYKIDFMEDVFRFLLQRDGIKGKLYREIPAVAVIVKVPPVMDRSGKVLCDSVYSIMVEDIIKQAVHILGVKIFAWNS